MGKMGRRDFLKSAAGAAAGMGVAGVSSIFGMAKAEENRGDNKNDKPEEKPLTRRKLGKTGFESTIFGLGGEITVERRDRREDAIEIINRAIDLGVNYIDTSHIYGRGGSEENIGQVLKERREEVFLATKSREKSYTQRAERLFEDGCERLQTEVIDAYFFHAVDRENDLNTILDRDNGAIKYFEKLREKGRIKNIAISSHTHSLLISAMEKYDFDCMLMSVNPAGMSIRDMDNAKRFFDKAMEKEVGVIAMKLAGKGNIFNRGVTMEQTMRYAYSFPISSAIVGVANLDELEENVRLAKKIEPYTEAEREQLVKRARG